MHISMSMLAAIAAAVMTIGSANAAAPPDGIAANDQAPPATQTGSAYKAPWHYEWQYHYDHHGEWVPGWVAVPNRIW